MLDSQPVMLAHVMQNFAKSWFYINHYIECDYSALSPLEELIDEGLLLVLLPGLQVMHDGNLFAALLLEHTLVAASHTITICNVDLSAACDFIISHQLLFDEVRDLRILHCRIDWKALRPFNGTSNCHSFDFDCARTFLVHSDLHWVLTVARYAADNDCIECRLDWVVLPKLFETMDAVF